MNNEEEKIENIEEGIAQETAAIEDSVEKYFCKPFAELPVEEMDKEGAEVLISLLMAKPATLENCPIPESEKPFLYKLIEKRIEHCLTFRITDFRLVLLLCSVSLSPGTAVMYLAYLQYWCKKNNKRQLNLEDFCDIFPHGFPSSEKLHELWTSTKVMVPQGKMASDNLLDYQPAYKSIQF